MRSTTWLVLSICLFFCLPGSANASSWEADVQLEMLKANSPASRLEHSPFHRMPTTYARLSEGPYPGPPLHVARAFLLEHSALLAGPLEELEPRLVLPIGKARDDGFGSHGAVVRYRQVRSGIPVPFDVVIVTLGPNGEVTALRQRMVEPAPLPAQSLSKDEAIRSARTALPFQGKAAARLILHPFGDKARLTWEVHPLPRGPGARDILIFVDAETGSLKGTENRQIYDGPQAYAYLANPYVEEEPSIVDLGESATDSLDDAYASVYNCVDQLETTPLLGADGVTYNAHVCSTEAAPRPTDGNYFYDPEPYPEDTARDEDLFAAPNMYYHVHAIGSFFRELGVPSVDSDPVVVVTNVRYPNSASQELLEDTASPLKTYNNAYFSASYYDDDDEKVPARMIFGQGTDSDFGYDADVIYHEFTHGVVNYLDGPGSYWASLYGVTDEPRAVDEALADFFSSTHQGDPNVGEYAGLRWAEDGRGVRDLTEDKRCPRDMIGEEHTDSQPLGSAMWAIREQLLDEDLETFNDTIFAAVSQMPKQTYLDDAGQAILDAIELFYDADARATAEGVLENYGVLGCAPFVPIEPAGLDSPFLDYTFVFGEETWGTQDSVPGNVQFRYEAPSGRQRVTIQFYQLEAKGVPLIEYGNDDSPQPVKVYDRAEEPTTYTFESSKGGATSIQPSTDKVTPAEATGTIEESESYYYHLYEASYVLEDSPGMHYIQFANGGQKTTYILDASMQIEAESDEDGGCGGCSSTGNARDALGNGLVIALALAPFFRTRRRRRRD